METKYLTRKQVVIYLFVVFITAANSSFAQLTVTGEIRPRTEYRHGYKSLIDTFQSGTVFTEQRTRLSFNYSSEKYKVGVTLQDVRIWGSQPQLNKTDGLSSLHEAWGEYFFTKKFSTQFGRQELTYDDERIFGGVSWTQQGRSHDLMLLKFSDSTFIAHIGVASNQNSETTVGVAYAVANNYKEMQFLWLNKKFSKVTASLLVVNSGLQSPLSVTSTRYSQTIGPHLEFKKDKIFVSLRGYYQMGTDGATKKDINAYFAGADIAYTIKSKLTLGVGGEILSGQSQTDTTKSYRDVNHSFNPLYGTAHKFNGFMDYFYVSNHLNTVGLTDIYFKLKYKVEKWWLGFDVHQFMTAADVVDTNILSQQGKYSAMSSSLGTELDMTFAYNLTNGITFQAGYSHMMGTETMEAIRGGSKDETNNWAYLMFTFKPQLFKN
ncbi:MAG TPA: alginate export family protein [Bacteroidia bacterium]|nr:alginate export family protein [Bacteroidia bacterium]